VHGGMGCGLWAACGLWLGWLWAVGAGPTQHTAAAGRQPTMFAALLLLPLPAALGAAVTGGAACTRDTDCQLNGGCQLNRCVCDPAWTGANCSTLSLNKASMANGYGHLGSNTSSWGAGVLHDPSGKWVMFASEMNMGCGLGTWGTNSRCILAEASTPAGPFTFVRTVVDSWCHGATPARDPATGKWLFNHMGAGVPKGGHGKPRLCKVCHGGTTPRGAAYGNCSRGEAGTVDTGFALTSDVPTGPYTPQPKMKNGANCEPFFLPNGTLFMACPSGGKTTAKNCNGNNAFLTMFRAASITDAIAGRYDAMPVRTRLAGTNDSYESTAAICFNWEDQTLYIDQRGSFHTLMHAFRGQPCDYPVCDRKANKTFCSAVGGHAYSTNGYDWDISPVIAYTPTQAWEDGTVTTFRARERPHMILDSEGNPTHLLNGVGDPCPGGGGGNTGCPGNGGDHTFTLIVPVGPT
jgi:hypothetical protein